MVDYLLSSLYPVDTNQPLHYQHLPHRQEQLFQYQQQLQQFIKETGAVPCCRKCRVPFILKNQLYYHNKIRHFKKSTVMNMGSSNKSNHDTQVAKKLKVGCNFPKKTSLNDAIVDVSGTLFMLHKFNARDIKDVLLNDVSLVLFYGDLELYFYKELSSIVKIKMNNLTYLSTLKHMTTNCINYKANYSKFSVHELENVKNNVVNQMACFYHYIQIGNLQLTYKKVL